MKSSVKAAGPGYIVLKVSGFRAGIRALWVLLRA